MGALPFQLLDVFTTGEPFSGNPLAVFTDARSISDATMQAIARQMNLSETTFLLPARLPESDAHVRIFTPGYEMPFAGHPTLGTASVAARAQGLSRVRLGMSAGVIPVEATGDRYTLSVSLVSARPLEVSVEALTSAVGLEQADIAGEPLRVDTGTEQVILPVRSAEAVARAQVDPARFLALPRGKQPTKILLWAKSGPDTVSCRFFFPTAAGGGSVIEDPGTGSAAANLGGWLIASGHAGGLLGPIHWALSQGERTGRPCALGLSVDGDQISVSGRVALRGEGQLYL